MRFRSTRTKNKFFSLSEALQLGLAPDGGLFVPEYFPKYDLYNFTKLNTIKEIAKEFLRPFFAGDKLEQSLEDICTQTFSFPIPLVTINNHKAVLELFHGPTGAFKDVGARFLAQCFEHLPTHNTILVATSGDTGSAVASAFHGLKKSKVVILFPQNKISAFQEKQITCWDDNILSLRVAGDFDTCQQLVKSAFMNKTMKSKFHLTSANSINIGRLLPQCTYYVAASLWHYRKTGKPANFIIPTGNMGNALAAIWVKYMGFPIDKIVLATNSNDTIPQYFMTGKFQPKSSIQTIANAMDVGNPSNIERFFDLPKQSNISAYAVTDEQIRSAIQQTMKIYGKVIDPHTATAFVLQSITSYIIIATAHPAKFASIVEPLTGVSIQIPDSLQQMLLREEQVTDITADLQQIKNELENFSWNFIDV